MILDNREPVTSNIWKYYLTSFLSNLQFFGPVYILFFQSFKFSLSQIFFFLSVYGITQIVLEIPTGILSDYIGRKKTLILSLVFIFLSFFIISVSSDYLLFLLAYVLMGVGSSLISGTDESFLYDSMIQTKSEKHYKKISGRARMLESIAISIGMLFGGFIFAYHFRLPYIITTIFIFAGLLVTITYIEPKRRSARGSVASHVRRSFSLSFGNKKVMYMILFSTLATFAFVMNFFTIQPYLKVSGIRVEHFGIILAAVTAIEAIIAFKAHKVEKIIGIRLSLLGMVAIPVVVYFLMSQIVNPFAATVFALFFGLLPTFTPIVISDYINRLIPSDKRATILSMKNLMHNLSYAIFAPVIGFLADTYSLQAALLLESVAIAILTVILLPRVFANL